MKTAAVIIFLVGITLNGSFLSAIEHEGKMKIDSSDAVVKGKSSMVVDADRGGSTQNSISGLRTSAADDKKEDSDVPGYDTAENSDFSGAEFRDADGDGIDDIAERALRDRGRKAAHLNADFDKNGMSASSGGGYTRGKCIGIFIDENGDGIDDLFLGRGSSQTKGKGHSGEVFGTEDVTDNDFGNKRGKTDTLMRGKGMKRRGNK